MSLADTQIAIGVFQDLIKALKLAWNEGRGAWKNYQISPIITALRTVYFPPSGSLSILERIANGEHVSEGDANKCLEIWDRDEPEVNEALVRLSYDNNFRKDFLPLTAVNNLDFVAFGKISIRHGVRELLGRHANGARVDREEVSKTVSLIKQLNTAVNELDAQLNRQS